MGEIVRHKKTGGLYEVLHWGAVIHSYVPLSDDAPVTVCRRLSDGQIVARVGSTPRGTFVVLHHSRLQTDVPCPDGSEVVVYRALDGGPVWVRRSVEMDDGRFEHADAPQSPSSTPGEVERLVDALVEQAHWVGRSEALGAWGHCKSKDRLDAARTALLSHISTAVRTETPIADENAQRAYRARRLNAAIDAFLAHDLAALGDRMRAALSAADATNPQE